MHKNDLMRKLIQRYGNEPFQLCKVELVFGRIIKNLERLVKENLLIKIKKDGAVFYQVNIKPEPKEDEKPGDTNKSI